MNRPKTIHRMTAPGGEVFELRSDRELSQFEITMWEIAQLFELARRKMKEPLFHVTLRRAGALALFLILPVCTARAEEVQRVQVDVDWSKPAPVNPFKLMEEKERRDAAEIKRLRERLDAHALLSAPQPHQSVLVPAIDYPERIQQVEHKQKEKLHGPSTGYHGARWKIKSYAGSQHFETKQLMPPQVRYE